MSELKITVIGAGSSYTPELIDGFIKNDFAQPIQICLYDIEQGEEKTKIIENFAKRMVNKTKKNINITSDMIIESALENCSFVINQFRVGFLDARIKDEKIPLKYGLIGQETTGAGGFFNAVRTIPEAIRIAQTMEKICPDAWIINFTNPSGIIVEAINRYSNIKCVGLCNVPYNMRIDIAKVLRTDVENVYCEFVGLNHLSFISEVYYMGKPILQSLIDKRVFASQLVKNIPKIEAVSDLIRQLRLIPSPYLQYFYFENEMFGKIKREVESGKGTRGEQVKKVVDELFEIYKDINISEKPSQLDRRGGAYYSTVAIQLIKALCSNTPTLQVINYCNNGAFSELSNKSVVETNCVIDYSGVRSLTYGSLPSQIKGLILQMKDYEKLTIESAVKGSKDLATLALLNNPLIHGYKNAACLINDMLSEYKDFLPRFN